MLAIDIKDPQADQINDVADIEKLFPGLLKASVEWFKIYKMPDGKSENQFAFNGEAKPAVFAQNIVEEVNYNQIDKKHEENVLVYFTVLPCITSV